MNFTPFIGVIEDIDDPIELGRARVRVFDVHSADIGEIPTDMLPWALVMQPCTSASVAGIGTSPSGLLPGSWVFGMFLDGARAQEPLILGSIPSVSANLPNPDVGFNDPNGEHPRRTGPDTNELARGIDTRRPETTTELLGFLMTNNYDAQYPHNHVFETPGGHFKEYDDTLGAKRIREQHSSNTYYEITDTGDKLNYIAGDRYTVIEINDELHVKGKVNIVIDGDADISVKGNLNADVNQSTTILCPSNTIDGELTVTGNVRVNGKVNVGDDVKTDIGVSLNKHKHPILSGSSAGLTDKPE